jgi:hypothetical protein
LLAWRRHRDDVLRGALDQLSAADRRVLAAAIPVLGRLSIALEAHQGAEAAAEASTGPAGRRAS